MFGFEMLATQFEDPQTNRPRGHNYRLQSILNYIVSKNPQKVTSDQHMWHLCTWFGPKIPKFFLL
jgi:hypothetical protein